jgi:hypothetical protein
MQAGESPDFGLEFDTWGMGLDHMARAADANCPYCHDTKLLGSPSFPIVCFHCTAGIEA